MMHEVIIRALRIEESAQSSTIQLTAERKRTLD